MSRRVKGERSAADMTVSSKTRSTECPWDKNERDSEFKFNLIYPRQLELQM